VFDGPVDYFYSLEMDGFRVGVNDAKSYSFQPNEQIDLFNNRGIYTIFDTATPDILITQVYFDSMMDVIVGN